jgi:hypothetical protein
VPTNLWRIAFLRSYSLATSMLVANDKLRWIQTVRGVVEKNETLFQSSSGPRATEMARGRKSSRHSYDNKDSSPSDLSFLKRQDFGFNNK